MKSAKGGMNNGADSTEQPGDSLGQGTLIEAVKSVIAQAVLYKFSGYPFHFDMHRLQYF